MSDDSDFKPSRKRLKIVKVGKPDLQSLSLPRVKDVTTKKMSPLKHVSPILKKYNSQRHGKSVKTLRPKANSDSQPVEVTTKDVKEQSSPDQLSSPPCILDVSVELRELSNDPEFFQEQLSSPVMASESFPDDAPKNVDEDHTNLGQRNDPASKEDLSPPINPTSKMVKITLTERKRSRIMKQKNRLQKELEHTVPLVAVDDKTACEEKGYQYALSYFLKIKERLEKDSETFEEFLRLMNDFSSSNNNVVDLYHRIATLLRDYPDLCEDFLAFLLPEQALLCNRFMEHLSLAEMMSFLRKLEVFFIKQPQHLKKIYACWEGLADNPNLTLEEVRSSILPLLKGNKLLEDCFMELLPGASPPESKMGYVGGTDVEVLAYEDMDSELSDEEKRSERVYVPGAKSDLYGGEHCHCCCHDTSDPSYASRSKHCVPCGMKFIAGKVYLQTEHGLRPVRVNFGGSANYSNNLQRLNSDPRKLQRPRGPRKSRASTTRPGGTPATPGPGAGPGAGAGASGTGSKDNSPVKGNVKPVIPEEKDDESCTKKSPRSRSKATSSRPKEKQAIRPPQAGSSRMNPRAKGKGKISLSPPAAAAYDEIALPAPEPTAAKSDATDFSVLSDVLRQEKIGQGRVEGPLRSEREVFQIGSDDSMGEEADKRPDSAIDGGDCDVIEEVDGEAISDCSDVSGGVGEGDGDSDEAMSVDSYGESDGDGESEGEGEMSSQEAEEYGRRQPWTREEDRIILQCFQAAGGQDDSKTFEKIGQLLPARTEEEIKERFHVLVKLIQQLT